MTETTQFMTAIFKCDLRKVNGNPHHKDTPFGRAVTLAVGDAITEQQAAALDAVEQARADGYAQGLHDSAHRYQSMAGPDSWDYFQEAVTAILALIPAEPCDTKSAENVTQAGLCQSDAQQAIKPTPAPAGKKGGTE
jgi:hypothetical protein